MKLREYLKDQIISIIIMSSVIVLIWIILRAFNYSGFLVVYIPLLIICAYLLMLSHDYFRKKKYYNHFTNILDNLDEKYLITELVEKPHFLDGKIMIDNIYEIDKAMKEHLNELLYRQSELKEYIEMWCHEVKTPVATSQLIIENNLNFVTNSIKEELVKIDDYVEQVLFYARSENVEKDYLIKDLDLSDLVNSVIKRNKKDLINKQIKIELDNLNMSVASDKKWLEFILNQIINNSIKYIDKEPVILFRAKKYKDRIELNIHDNGIGILESELKRVFDKGFTGTIGRQKQKSTGIGLYLCKKLCLRLNHEIKIDSNGDGTTVTIIFPISSYVTLH
ncbi:sensor histidine kinase [Thomasclavelia cocleata]|uniref:sensor histidine kinase n=1 Tax=Thomasclavelia cocleata TaxID=69824 RepID=UPI00242DA002|nr:sensor histidine kinase [Thomasclavelia cocleata]